MNKNELIEFLLEKQGYLKEGAKRLAFKLDVDEDTAMEALREARRIAREEDEELENLVLKSRWQVANGEWRESYTAKPCAKQKEELNEIKQELLDSLKDVSAVQKITSQVEDKETSYALEINLPDFHFGKRDGLNITQQGALYVSAVKELVDKSSSYTISEIILPIGNDILNSEGMRKSTTKGTPQDDNSDWKQSFRVAWVSVVSAIKFLADIAPVRVVTVLGNHDFERSFYLGELLEATFFNDERVDVINNGNERNYITFGKNLIAYTHGDKVKPQDLPLIMATEVPVEFSQSNTRSWRLGHLHKHMKDEYRGIEVEYLPALCGSDEWHKAMGYYSDRKAMAYVWDYEGGKAGFVQINKYR